MTNIKSLFVFLLVISTVANAQFLTKTTRGFYAVSSVVALPSVPGNGALDNASATIGLGVGVFFKVDALRFEGDLTYLHAKSRLSSASARLMSDLAIRSDPVTYQWSAGFNYRQFTAAWELQCLGLSLQYDSRDKWFLRPEFGFATRSLKTGRETAVYGMINFGYTFGWRD